MVVSVEREPSFHTTRAEEMFSASYVTGNVSITYDVAPDGQHFATSGGTGDGIKRSRGVSSRAPRCEGRRHHGDRRRSRADGGP